MDTNENPKVDRTIDRILALLRKEYVIMGSTHVKAWRAWLLVGLAAGILIGIILVANRSGEFEPTKAVDTNQGISVELHFPPYYGDFLRHPQKFFSGRAIRIISAFPVTLDSALLTNSTSGISQTLSAAESEEESTSPVFEIPASIPTGRYILTAEVGGQQQQIPIDIQGLSDAESSFAIPDVAASLSQLIAIPYRAKICNFCFWEMVFAGVPNDPLKLFHVGSWALSESTSGGGYTLNPGTLSRSADAGRIWSSAQVNAIVASPNPPPKYRGDQKMGTLNDGSFLLSANASAFGNPIYGGFLYSGYASGGLAASVIKNGTSTSPACGSYADYGKLAIDQRLPGTPIIYVSEIASLTGQADCWNALYISQDGGKNFREYGLYPLGTANLIRSLSVGDDGTLYAGVNSYYDGFFAPAVLRFTAMNPPSFVTSPLPNNSTAFAPPRLSNASYRAWHAYYGPVIIADTNPASPHRGRVYAIWARPEKIITNTNFEYSSYGYNFDIYESFSDDHAQTWSMPVRVNDDLEGGGDQIFPSAAVSSDGVLHVAFVDHRNFQNLPVFDVYYAKSSDGVKFSKNLRVNADLIANSILGGRTIGDYLDMIAAYSRKAYVAYPCGQSPLGPTAACMAEINHSFVK